MTTYDTAWNSLGNCYDLPRSADQDDQDIYESFFADRPVDRKPAQSFCEGCPVQKTCLKYALESEQLYGVWGGRDEAEIRRDLWVHSTGIVGNRSRTPRCPWCRADGCTLVVVDRENYLVECTSCSFSWKAESTIRGLDNLERD